MMPPAPKLLSTTKSTVKNSLTSFYMVAHHKVSQLLTHASYWLISKVACIRDFLLRPLVQSRPSQRLNISKPKKWRHKEINIRRARRRRTTQQTDKLVLRIYKPLQSVMLMKNILTLAAELKSLSWGITTSVTTNFGTDRIKMESVAWWEPKYFKHNEEDQAQTTIQRMETGLKATMKIS
jgi:hypothetical protein